MQRGGRQFYGWGVLEYTLANLYDLVHQIAAAFGKKKLKKADRYPRPQASILQDDLSQHSVSKFLAERGRKEVIS